MKIKIKNKYNLSNYQKFEFNNSFVLNEEEEID